MAKHLCAGTGEVGNVGVIRSGFPSPPANLLCLMDTGQADQPGRKRPRSPHLDTLAKRGEALSPCLWSWGRD